MKSTNCFCNFCGDPIRVANLPDRAVVAQGCSLQYQDGKAHHRAFKVDALADADIHLCGHCLECLRSTRLIG